MGGKKEIYRHVRFFHGALSILDYVNNHDDCTLLQKDPARLIIWSQVWQMPFNVDKFKVILAGPELVTHGLGWVAGRGFDSRPPHCRVATLDKSFTHAQRL